MSHLANAHRNIILRTAFTFTPPSDLLPPDSDDSCEVRVFQKGSAVLQIDAPLTLCRRCASRDWNIVLSGCFCLGALTSPRMR